MFARRSHRSVFAHLVFGACLSLLACSATQETDAPAQDVTAQSQSQELVTVTTPDGALYTFLDAGGEVGVLVEAPESARAKLQLPDEGGSLKAFYERISGRPAPQVLLDALSREENARGLSSANQTRIEPTPAAQFSKGVSAPLQGDVGIASQALTAAEFQDKFCNSGYDFLYCWPNTSGNPWVQIYSDVMHGAISAIDCAVRFRYRYEADGWKTFVDRYATPGKWYHYYTGTGTRHRRFEVIGNDEGCRMHFAVWGNY
ncbi:MAG TPA: hypothetical protein VFQ61_14705 [Polyangiaceae bacterium]|nr:hypothetical protein [Polyangiaceae bacterium]